MTKALIRAAMWLDAGGNANRRHAVEILARPNYVGADAEVIARSMTGTFEYLPDDTRPAPDFNVFFRYHATQPFYSHAIWYLTQMRRWGQIASAQPDSWYDATAKSVYRPDIYLAAAKALVAEGKASTSDFLWNSDGYLPPNRDFIDGVSFDARKPNDYLGRFALGLKADQRVAGDKVTMQ
jgi:nitrate/nitrite transport system substrate-binding protein